MEFMRRLLAFACVLVLAVVSSGGTDAGKSHEVVAPLHNQPMAEALRLAAEREGIRWQDKLELVPEALPRPGDSLVLLVGACDGEITRQWLLSMRRGLATKADSEGADHQVSMFSCWGPVSVFNANPEPLELTLIGPVQVNPVPGPRREAQPPVKRTRVLVPGAYMRLGLDGTARSLLHLMEANRRLMKDDPDYRRVNLWSRTSPVPAEEIRLYKPIVARLGWTIGQERLFVGGLVSLQSFYEIAKSVPELREIAMTVINHPSVWAMAKAAFGAGPHTQFYLNETLCPLQAREAGLLETGFEAYQIPFEMSLQDSTLVNCMMGVTRPVPPLDVSAGILALVAFHPKDARRVIEVKLIGFGL